MQRRFHTLDVFTDTRFAGNPLAVVLEPEGLTSEAMQTIAREFNLAETVFVLPPESPAHRARMRIFTPAAELPFAGHPTVGTAVLLARIDGGARARELVLEEGIGPVRCRVTTKTGDAGTRPLRPYAPAEAGRRRRRGVAHCGRARAGARRPRLRRLRPGHMVGRQCVFHHSGARPRCDEARPSRTSRTGARSSRCAATGALAARAVPVLHRDCRARPRLPRAHVRAPHGHSRGPGHRFGGGRVRGRRCRAGGARRRRACVA